MNIRYSPENITRRVNMDISFCDEIISPWITRIFLLYDWYLIGI